MIFLTVGSVLPFERLVAAVDDWAGRHPETEIFAQTKGGRYTPRHMAHAEILSPAEFARRLDAAELIIAHAGMGSAIMAAERAKPVILFPRRAALREHTTDHQLDTVKFLEGRPGIHVATDPETLDRAIAEARKGGGGERLSSAAPPTFIANLRAAIAALD
ncbi:glycosyltransferase [Arsenicitalea aurantiaca]|uniref:glycosyltransferase n=1 Tax=Arsenicitalea aurantiaca TaxID=1783274 RepID=UPI0013153A85|nr:glycosyltransferase [Arsenicitalea aurantiaca]